MMTEKDATPKTNLGFFSKLGGFLDNYGALFGSVIGTVILGFSTNLISTPSDLIDFSRTQTWTEYFGVVLFSGGTYLLARNGMRVSKLEHENKLLNQLVKSLGDDIQDKWRQILMQVAQDLGLGNSERISIYRNEGSFFIMLGRFSIDPQKQKTGRGYYSINEGCIGRAYQDGESFVLDLPDSSDNDYYIRTSHEWGIDPTISSTFKMKARSIAAFALADPKSLKRSLILVFESTDAKAFKKKDLRAAHEIYNDMLCALENTLEPLLPSLHYAKQKGF